MMIGEISFCEQIGFNIKSDETKHFILDRIQRKYGLKIITKHFDKYEDRMLENIQKRPHLLCVRSNGNPYFLYLTKINFVNYCIFIDKKIQQGYSYPRMIISHFKFNDNLFDDTILDGEMVKNSSGGWSFLLNDMLVLRGQHLTEYNLMKRLNLLYAALESSFVPDVNDICKMLVKKYFNYTESLQITEHHIHEVDYSCRGIYFKPLFLRFKDILINFDDNLIKKVERTRYKHLKSFMLTEDGEKLLDPETSSISSNSSAKSHGSSKSLSGVSNASCETKGDQRVAASDVVVTERVTGVVSFNTRKTSSPDVYELLDGNMQLVGTCAVPSIKISKYMREVFANKNIVDTVSMHFIFSTKFNKWIPTLE